MGRITKFLLTLETATAFVTAVSSEESPKNEKCEGLVLNKAEEFSRGTKRRPNSRWPLEIREAAEAIH